MSESDLPVLVIGSTGFVGRRVVAALESQGRAARAMARAPQKAQDLISDLVSVVPGDMLDAAAVRRAVEGVGAVVFCVHTLSQQAGASHEQDYMDVEAQGLRNVVAACRAAGVSRVIYVTSIGVAEHGTSSWLRGRWRTEQALFASGLDVTVLRPGMIVGRGGDGFGIVARGATSRFAVAVAGPRQRFRTVAVDDLAHDVVDVIGMPAAVGAAFDVGSDDVLTIREMTQIAATSIGRRPGVTVFIPGGLVRRLAPLIERVGRVPRGAISGFIGDGQREDMTGDPTRLRAILGRTDRPFLAAIAGQLP